MHMDKAGGVDQPAEGWRGEEPNVRIPPRLLKREMVPVRMEDAARKLPPAAPIGSVRNGDQQLSTGPQDAQCLNEGVLGSEKMLQHLEHEHSVAGRILQWQRDSVIDERDVESVLSCRFDRGARNIETTVMADSTAYPLTVARPVATPHIHDLVDARQKTVEERVQLRRTKARCPVRPRPVVVIVVADAHSRESRSLGQ
jgi:hypothetical protein